MPIDFTTVTGQVRLLINDVDESSLVFSNDEIAAFLTLSRENPKRAAARALETIAANEALTSKVISDHQLQTDGAKLAAELRALAASLRLEATGDDTLEAGTPVYSFPDPDAKIDPNVLGWL